MKTGGRVRKRQQRTHKEHDQRILDDYYGTPAVTLDGKIIEAKKPAWQFLQDFYRRFRMGPKLFSKLLFEIQHEETGYPEFRPQPDALGQLGPSALHRLTAVIRILAYGIPFDAVKEYTRVSENIAIKRTYAFCDWLAAKYLDTHLGVWTPEAIDKELAINAERGFPGMLGSIDCTHWVWKNCPYPWQGQYQDRDGNRSVIAEAIVGSDIYFWHVFLGVPVSQNDLHVLGVSSLFFKYLQSGAATRKFKIGDQEYTGLHFLADGIYPDYAVFMKTYGYPCCHKERLFAKMQEGARKDVERAFGRLMIKWVITGVPCRSWFRENLAKVWLACFILHNMTIRDNEDKGYNEEMGTMRDDQLKKE